MSNIVGTTISLKNYLEQTESRIVVRPQEPGSQEICLYPDRRYIIPDFQRELRWELDNVNILLSDLSRGEIFLGNIILTIKGDHSCEIIDGQQRTTILVLLLSWLQMKYGTALELPVPCKIENMSFPGFQRLVEICFNSSAVSETEWNQLLSADIYAQYPRIKKIWDEFGKSKVLDNRHNARSLINNLNNSTLNIIANRSENLDNSIRYFIDVNLKGIHLDTEDIFKAYLFKQDSSVATRRLWADNKQIVKELNDTHISKGGQKGKGYPLMKLYEHFLYCDLYLPSTENQRYEEVLFGEDFCLTKEIQLDGNNFYKGTHVIEVISDRSYMHNMLTKIHSAAEIMIDIIRNEGPSDKFKNMFAVSGTQHLDSTEIRIFHSLLKKILLDNETIPKILALKYITSFFDGNGHTKQEYKSIYSVFSSAVIFSSFAFKKKSDPFFDAVKSPEWVEKINIWLYQYASTPDLTKGKLLAAYRCEEKDEANTEDQIRCKSLAAIYNYFRLNRNGNSFHLSIRNTAELNSFLHNAEEYSLEHFIIGESGSLQIKTDKFDFSFDYPSTIKRYRNSLFNFVFIPRRINDELKNELIYQKLQYLYLHSELIQCDYSKQYISLIDSQDKPFSRYPTKAVLDGCPNEEAARDYLTNYFERIFPEEFFDFSNKLLKMITWIQ